MRAPYEISLALRYMMSRRKDAFVSLITTISTGGIALGVAALIIVLSVMNGFESDLKAKILGTNAHVIVLRSGGGMAAYEALSRDIFEKQGEDLVGISPFIYNQGMLTSRANVIGGVIRGLDVSTVTTVTEVKNYIIRGELQDLLPAKTVETIETDHLASESVDEPVEGFDTEMDIPPNPGIGLGKELALNLGVDIGDTINLVSPTGELTPFGNAPRIREYEVRMIFSTGMYEYDSGLAYLALDEAQDFFSMEGVVTGLEIKLHDPDDSDLIAARIGGQLGFPYYTRDWKEMNKNLFGALELEKLAMSIILVLIVMVAGFNIVSTLFMVVIQKGRDIAILKSMGASAAGVRRIFMFEGLVIGAFGATIGLVLGVSLTLLLDKYQFIKLPKDIYYIESLPVLMVGWEILAIVVGALLISVLATMYPAWRASRLDPAEGIRYGAE